MNPDLCICLDRWPSAPDAAAGNTVPEICQLCNRRIFTHGGLPVLNLATHRIEYPEHGPQETCAADWEPRGFSAAAWRRIRGSWGRSALQEVFAW